MANPHPHISRTRPQPHPDEVLSEFLRRRRTNTPEENHPAPNSGLPTDVPPTLPPAKATTTWKQPPAHILAQHSWIYRTPDDSSPEMNHPAAAKKAPPTVKANEPLPLGPPAKKAPPPGYEWAQPITSMPAFAVLKAPPPSWVTTVVTHSWPKSAPMKAPPVWLTDYSVAVATAQHPASTSSGAFKRPPPPTRSDTHTSDGWPKPFAVKDNSIPKPWTAKQGKFNIFETEPPRRPIQPEPKFPPKPPAPSSNLPNA